MKDFVSFCKSIGHFVKCLGSILACLYHLCHDLLLSVFHVLLFRVNPFWIQLSYFIILSLVGYLGLKFSKPKITSFRLKDIDVFFTSVSAVTVSSMSTVEMEDFSDTQLVILTILMILGGEVFTSLLSLQMRKYKFSKIKEGIENKVQSDEMGSDSSNLANSGDQIELGLVTGSESLDNQNPNIEVEAGIESLGCVNLKYNCIKCLGYVVLSYVFVVHVVGCALIYLYIILVPSAREVLTNKGIRIQTFTLFTTVATFSNCGFLLTNESMVVFKKNTGLLLILIPHVLLGNTLYPPCLRFLLFILERITKRVEFSYMLKNYRDLGYSHLLSRLHSCFLALTVFGFILVQFILFTFLEWNSLFMDGLNSYQKLVGSLFQVVNSRHAGESVFDLSTISPALMVLFAVMMYLPPYTSFLPIKDHEKVSKHDKKFNRQRKNSLGYLLFSPLSYLAVFTILICITEREKLEEDPLNYNVWSIIVEVISAYGNVGFSIGYSCKRRIKPAGYCKDAWYGFVGRWTDNGKLVLVLVMFFGRLNKFCIEGGTAWKLS